MIQDARHDIPKNTAETPVGLQDVPSDATCQATDSSFRSPISVETADKGGDGAEDGPEEIQDGQATDAHQYGPTQTPNSHVYEHPPTLDQARSAMDDLAKLLKPPRLTGAGYKDPMVDLLLRERLEHMKLFLWAYIDPKSATFEKWIGASLQVANAVQRKPWYGRTLQMRVRAFISDRDNLPFNIYGEWNESLIDKDEDLAQEIHMHLQSIGKYVKAMDLVDFLDTPRMRERTKMEKRISLATAQHWMKKLDYRWTQNPKGQFVDGHEREDIVAYR